MSNYVQLSSGAVNNGADSNIAATATAISHDYDSERAGARSPPILQRAIVRYPYEAEDGNQLSLHVGNVVTIHSQDSADWWGE